MSMASHAYYRRRLINRRPCSSRRPIAAPSRHAASAPSGPPIVESGRTARVAGAHPGRVNRCRAHVAGQRLWVGLQTATARLPSHAKARFTGGLALFVPHPAAPPDQLPPPAAAARAAALRWSPVPPPLALAAGLFFFFFRCCCCCPSAAAGAHALPAPISLAAAPPLSSGSRHPPAASAPLAAPAAPSALSSAARARFR